MLFSCALVPIFLLLSRRVLADVVLYVPGTEEQPISAEPLGNSPDGKTTWKLLPGKPTGTWTQSGFPLTATLVSGPSNAVLQYTDDPIAVTYSCTISGGRSNCNAVWVDPTGAYSRSIQETVRPFPVQAVADPSVTPSASSGSDPSNPSPGTPTNTGNAAAQSNAAVSSERGSAVGGLIAALIGAWLMRNELL